MTRIAAALLAVLASSAVARAQSYEVSWWTVDGGGTMGAAGGTFALSGTAGQPDAGGPFAGGTFGAYGGFWAMSAGGAVGPLADLSITKTDGQSSATPGQPIAYTIAATNAGPSPVTSATVSDTPPGALTGVAWTCVGAAGGSCPPSGGGGINASVNLPVGGTVTFTLTATIAPSATGSIANTATVGVPAGVTDPLGANNLATDTDLLTSVTRLELAHGARLRATLASVGGIPDVDFYRIRQQPFSSYEVVVDETSGDIGVAAGPALDRVAADGSTVLQSSVAVGTGPSRSLRFVNATSSPIDDQLVRVRSTSCGSSCGADDVYRLRAWETTGSIPRFNNSGSQVTVLLLQNATSLAISGTVYAWSPTGALAGQQPIVLPPHGIAVLNTGTLASGASGSLTVAHDGPYGSIVGKTVALEPATGYSFDAPLTPRPR